MKARAKERLLRHWRTRTYPRLGVSKISGVGVLAAQRIPAGTNPFPTHSRRHDSTMQLTPQDVAGLPAHVRKCVHDFFLADEHGTFHVAKKALSELDVSFYLNHSETPNVKLNYTSAGQNGFVPFETLCAIESGEELSFNYNTGIPSGGARIDSTYFKNDVGVPCI